MAVKSALRMLTEVIHMKRINIQELPEQALDDTLRKYANGITYGDTTWTKCETCNAIDNIAEQKNKTVFLWDRCEQLCPLYISGWCRNKNSRSKLYRSRSYDYVKDVDKYNRWIKDVNNYIWWITNELELMRDEYEKNWVTFDER